MRILVTLIALLFAGNAMAQSQEPPQAPPKASHKQQANPKHHEQTTPQDQRGTEKAPVFIKVIPPLTVEPQAAKETESYNDEASPEWALVYVTIALVMFTGGLMIYTAFLWGATKSLAEDSKRTAVQQAKDMRASLATAEKAAVAAERSAEVASKSLSIAQRAFVFGKGFTYRTNIVIKDNRIKEYVFWTDWENAGSTPATDVESWIDTKTIPRSITQIQTFARDAQSGASTVLGPRLNCRTPYRPIPLTTMMESWMNQTTIYIWSRIEYRDIFNPQIVHHHEQCAFVHPLRDPSIIPQQGDPAYVEFGFCGPQNSTG